MLTRRGFAGVASCAICGLAGFLAEDASAQGAAQPAITTPGAGIPMTWNDPMFTNMTEKTSQVTLSVGQNLSNYSVTAYTPGDLCITTSGGGGGGVNTISYCRAQGNQPLRINAGIFTVNNCYLNCNTTLTATHGEAIQCYDRGPLAPA
jgi:hypothetical protein